MIVRGNAVTQAFARWAAQKCNAIIAKRQPDFIVGGADEPYLLRWYIFPRNRWGNIYIHEYHRPDADEALHDHPWHSFSLCLTGTIIDISGHEDDPRIVYVDPGDMAFRGTKRPHRIDLPYGKIGQRTLFVMGPRFREWGFHCKEKGWVHWKTFTARSSHDASVQRGCE